MKFRAFLLKLISDIRASYWFIPACLAGLAVITARVLVWVEYENHWVSDLIPSSLNDTKIEDARLILSVIGSQFCALIARLKTIPPSDRSRYNLFTAPFYPNEIWRIGGNRK